jgi:hypothetical protein
MGIKDESWCASCGEGMNYTEDENANCGTCEKDYAITLVEGMIRYVENLKNELEEKFSVAGGRDTNDYLEGAVETATEIHAELVDRYQNA